MPTARPNASGRQSSIQLRRTTSLAPQSTPKPPHNSNPTPASATMLNPSEQAHRPLVQSLPSDAEPAHQPASPPTLAVKPLAPLVENLAHPITPLKPSITSSSDRHKGKQKRKSVAFVMPAPQHHSNIEANKEFWDVVNRQVAIIEQARLKAPSVSNPPSAFSPSNASGDLYHGAHLDNTQLVQSQDSSDSGSSIAADSPPSSPSASNLNARNPNDGHVGEEPQFGINFASVNVVNEANMYVTDLTNQHPLSSPRSPSHLAKEAGTPSVCPNAAEPNASATVLHMEPEHTTLVIPAPIPPMIGHQSCTLKQYLSTPPSLTEQQSEAIERFKRKVQVNAQIRGSQIIVANTANPFEVLQQEHSDDDGGSVNVASYNSDTDDGLIEPIDMGYQSADGHSSYTNKTPKHAPSGRKINKRHPNIPLTVRLRARKSSYPTTP